MKKKCHPSHWCGVIYESSSGTYDCYEDNKCNSYVTKTSNLPSLVSLAMFHNIPGTIRATGHISNDHKTTTKDWKLHEDTTRDDSFSVPTLAGRRALQWQVLRVRGPGGYQGELQGLQTSDFVLQNLNSPVVFLCWTRPTRNIELLKFKFFAA